MGNTQFLSNNPKFRIYFLQTENNTAIVKSFVVVVVMFTDA